MPNSDEDIEDTILQEYGDKLTDTEEEILRTSQRKMKQLPTKYNGKDYTKVIDKAIYKARHRYSYPSTNAEMGVKKILGRAYYAQLLTEEIKALKIPTTLKAELIGDDSIKSMNTPKLDGSGQGNRTNINRGECDTPKETGQGQMYLNPSLVTNIPTERKTKKRRTKKIKL